MSAERFRSAHFTGAGSILSLGYMVAAAVSMHLPNVLDIESYPFRRKRNQNDDDFPTSAEPLPSLSMAYELVASYFDRGFQKVSPFMRREEVYGQIKRLYDALHDSTLAKRRNDLFQLFMVFAIGASYMRNKPPSISPIKYYATAIRYLDALYQSTAEKQVQNTLLLVVFAYQHDIGIGSKWKLSRQAMRICIQQGWHRKPALSQDPIIEQVHQRLFWCCYVQERFGACNLGHPIVIAEKDITVELPSDTSLDSRVVSGRGCLPSEVSVLKRQVHLRRITTRARQELYKGWRDGTQTDAQSKIIVANELNEELENWRQKFVDYTTLPDAISIFETKEYLEINFHRERINIYSGLAVSPASDPSTFRPGVSHLRYCLDSSIQIIYLYQVLASKQIHIRNWTYVQDLLRSGFMILYCGIYMPRILRDYPAASPNVFPEIREPSSIIDAINECCSMLNDISQTWKAVNPHRIALERLSDEVKRLIELTSSPPSLEDHTGRNADFSLSGRTSGTAHIAEQGLWDAPFDVSSWDDLMQEDIDMREVFGIDFPPISSN